MLPVLLAGASAVVWGAADYFGGIASVRGVSALRQRAIVVALLAHICAIPVIVLLLFFMPGTPSLTPMLWGAAAGVCSIIGVITLNIGLASGAMAAVAPVAGVAAALVPLLGGLLMGERPALAAVVGVATAVGAIVMVSGGVSARQSLLRPGVLVIALASGVAFGLFFLLLGQAGKEAGMWPLLADKLVSVELGLAALLCLGPSALRRLDLSRTVLILAALSGACDAVATAFYLLSAHHGQISIVAPLAALYPAGTVALALIFNRERLRPMQFAGLGLAGVALVLAAS